MTWRSVCRLVVVTGGLCLAAHGARAQPADAPHEHDAAASVGVGGELTATLSRADHAAYFNYTDYDRDALRIARLRLFGEWRPVDRLAIIGEVRAENVDSLQVAALYARWQPWTAEQLFIQAGRIPPVLGAFARHAYGRDNLVSGLPLAYQYLTSLRPDALPLTVDDLLRMRGRGWRPTYEIGSSAETSGIPIVSGSRWDTGISTTWRRGWLEAAGALTLGAPGVPVVRETNGGRLWSGRVAATLPEGLSLGLSAARGSWLDDRVLALISGGTTRPATESVVGLDAEFGRGRWLFRHEWWHATFDLPLAGDLSNLRLQAWSGFLEGRYRFHARWQTAVRIDRLAFAPVRGDVTSPVTWDADVDRVEVVLGFRATRRAEIRAGLQDNWRKGGRVRERMYPTLALIYWF